MNRRDSIKNIAAGTIGLAAFSYFLSCKDSTGSSDTSVAEESTFFTSTEKNTLTSIADTIIPAGTSIGALSVGTDKFMERLFEKCYEKEVQDNIKTQFAVLDEKAQQAHGSVFAKCNQKQREDLLLAFSTSENEKEKDFFELMKAETIRGFSTSKEVMVKYLNYEIAPGRYHGCVDVKTSA